MSRVCIVSTKSRADTKERAALLREDGNEVTILDVDGHAQPLSSSSSVIPLATDTSVVVRARGGGTNAYACYVWLKEQSFEVVHFPDHGGLGFYCLMAKHQGLAFESTEIRLDRCGTTLAIRQERAEFLHGLGDLEIDYMERECVALEQKLDQRTKAAPPLDEWPSVTVCITHFNRPSYLAEAIASILAQDYASFDVVVVDDGSTDPAALAYLDELESDFEERGWKVIRQENRYLGAARNAAAKHARGDYLLFMDDDNVALPFEISTFATAAVNSEADILTCFMECFRESPDEPDYRRLFLGGPWTAGLFHNCFGDANALIRRSAFEEVGGFTEDTGVTHEDWELFATAVSKGMRLEVVPEVLFRYRLSPEGMIRTTNGYRNHQRSLRPYMDSAPARLRDVLPLAQALELRSQKRTELDANVSYNLGAGAALAEVGESESATTHLLTALKAAQNAGDPRWLAETMISVASSLVVLGDAQTADQTLKSAIGLAEESGDTEIVERAALARKRLS